MNERHMESASTGEMKLLTDELAQGMEKAMQLRLHLSFSEAEDLLLQRIISTFEKALCFLKWSGHVLGGPPSSADGSSRSDDLNKNFTDYHDHGDTSKKR